MSWSELSKELVSTLKLKTDPVAFSRLENTADLEKIKNVQRIPQLYTFCQAIFQVRAGRITIGVTKEDRMNIRCMRLHGIRHTSEKSMQAEAEVLSTTWFANPAEAFQQQMDSPRVPVAGAIIIAPLDKDKFEPEVVLVYGNSAQIMMLLCGLQKEKYERFDFHFIGEGACADSLGECYKTGRPQLAIPCYGERAMGQVSDDEIILALPPAEIPRALAGLKKLSKIGLKYPIQPIGATVDIEPVLSRAYPQQFYKQG